MKFIESPSNEPHFNLALEEYLLKETNEEFALVYINNPSVIVGKNQNVYAETDTHFLHALKIPVYRRLSGGGAVYHDKGNINFSFIQHAGEKLIDFEGRSRLIIAFLKMMGLDASLGRKNEINVGDVKISGSAEHIYKKRVLHHGTLLFSSSVDILRKSLKRQSGVYYDKTVPSNIAQVENIRTLLNNNLDFEAFKSSFNDFVLNYFEAEFYSLDPEDILNIEDISLKYKTWEWNYGLSPRYVSKKAVNTPFGHKDIEMEVDNGIIQKIACHNDDVLSMELSDFFTGKQHRYDLLFDQVGDENLLSLYYHMF